MPKIFMEKVSFIIWPNSLITNLLWITMNILKNCSIITIVYHIRKEKQKKWNYINN